MSTFPSHKPQRLIVSAVTGDWAFAAATLILALRRHNPDLAADFLLLHDASLPAHDQALLTTLGFHCELFQATSVPLPAQSLALFSPLCLAKFRCFSALENYETVLWLDADTIIQDDISPLFTFGPLSLAPEDPEFSETHQTLPARINVLGEVPGLDGTRPNYNSGVIVLNNNLPANDLTAFCHNFLNTQARLLRYPDQAIFNALVQELENKKPELFTPLPRHFNCHPRNPLSLKAPLYTLLAPISSGMTG
ncbi:MAG: glycosyltransferase [Desulfovibrio sp.]|nr:glycosyltransferase [Desulfovibrio sp.]